jgi:hypothetical protein
MAPGLNAGISYKIFQFRNDCSGFCDGGGFAATTHAVDVGLQYHPQLWRALQLGRRDHPSRSAAAGLQCRAGGSDAERVRVGAAYEVMHHFSTDTTTALWLSQTCQVPGGRVWSVAQALASSWCSTRPIYLRGGYSTGSGPHSGAGVGIGLRYDRFEVGIARSFVSSAGGSPRTRSRSPSR